MNLEEGVSEKMIESHFKEEVPFDLGYLTSDLKFGFLFPGIPRTAIFVSPTREQPFCIYAPTWQSTVSSPHTRPSPKSEQKQLLKLS